MELHVDPARKVPEGTEPGTGIYVRAKDGEKWGSFDIMELTKESLLLWLRSRGDMSPWAENTVGILLGYDVPLTDPEEKNWLIWSNEHNGWWGPNSYGYVKDRTAAGRYSYEEATRIVRNANLTKDTPPNEAMVRDER